jgi:hypothetical protein
MFSDAPSMLRLSVWSLLGFSRLVQHNSRQAREIDQGLELLVRRGLLGLKNVAQAFLLLFNQTDGYVDRSCCGDRGIAWGWQGTRPFDSTGERFCSLRCYRGYARAPEDKR